MDITAITSHKIRLGGILAVLLMITAFIIFFATTDQEALRNDVEQFLALARGSVWAFPLTLAFYVFGGLVMFPVTVTNLAVAIVFGLWGIVYALVGAMVAAMLYFGFGRMIKRHGLSQKILAIPRVNKIDTALEKSGVIGITLLRYVPIAPFSLFNLVSGIASIRFSNYVAATFMALLPGAVGRGILGDSLTKVFLNPTPETWGYLGAGLALWLGLLLGVHYFLKKLRTRQPASDSSARRSRLR